MFRNLSLVFALSWALPALAQFEALFDKVRPAVVTLYTRGPGSEGSGTGFILREDGLVATAQHVIRGSKSIVAQFADKRTVRALRVVEEDTELDYALVQLEPGSYPTVELGSDGALRQGQKILTLGNPLGLDFSASDGMVSARRPPHFQFTAPISPGNSGGPVFDLEGKVVGLTVFKRKDGENLNFALGIDYVRRALDRSAEPEDQGSEAWFVVASEAQEHVQTYNVFNDDDPNAMNSWVNGQWDKGLKLTSVAAGKGRWIALMEDRKDLGQQHVTYERVFPEVEVQHKWNDGFFVTHLAHGNDAWVVVMSRTSAVAEQTLLVSTRFPTERIAARSKDGFHVQCLAGSQDRWYVVMAKGLPYVEQQVQTFESVPRDWIQANWDKGLFLTAVGGNGLEWAAVMSKGSPIAAQSWWSGGEWPEEWIDSQWKKKWLVTGVY